MHFGQFTIACFAPDELKGLTLQTVRHHIETTVFNATALLEQLQRAGRVDMTPEEVADARRKVAEYATMGLQKIWVKNEADKVDPLLHPA